MIAESTPYFSQLQYTQSPRSQVNNNDERHETLKDHQTRPVFDETNVTDHDHSLAWSSGDQEKYFSNRHERQVQLSPPQQQQISSTPSSLSDFEHKQNLEETERLKNNPNITSLIEDIIENTIWNTLQEAYHNEFSLTARPRLIALPPKRQSPQLIRANLQQTDSNQFNFLPPPIIMTESFD
jgi:hypothetical protein